MAKGTQPRPALADVIDIRTRSRSGADEQRPGRLSLAPSDFAFLWDECPRCFYLKVVRKERRPHMPFPKVFGTIDRAMKAFYMGQRTVALAADMPPGVICQADDPTFLRFLIEVSSVVDEPEPPMASPVCVWCHWRAENCAVS